MRTLRCAEKWFRRAILLACVSGVCLYLHCYSEVRPKALIMMIGIISSVSGIVCLVVETLGPRPKC
jgi:hypothetical protein